jgi:hypothetical protein
MAENRAGMQRLLATYIEAEKPKMACSSQPLILSARLPD